MSITSEAKKEVERLLQSGQKIEAVNYLRDTFNVSLPEAKLLVEAVEEQLRASTAAPDAALPQVPSATALDGQLKATVISLLLANKKIEAVKQVKDKLNTGLKEALVMVEEVQREIDPNFKSRSIGKGCMLGGLLLFKIVFGFVGILFLSIAGGIYYFQAKSISSSELVTGRVIEFRYSDGGSAPIIAYNWNGQEKRYESSTYSNPPSYDMDEQVSVYVNRNDPNDVIVDTFSDRWFLIFIFGLIGSVFTAITAGFVFVGRSLKA